MINIIDLGANLDSNRITIYNNSLANSQENIELINSVTNDEKLKGKIVFPFKSKNNNGDKNITKDIKNKHIAIICKDKNSNNITRSNFYIKNQPNINLVSSINKNPYASKKNVLTKSLPRHYHNSSKSKYATNKIINLFDLKKLQFPLVGNQLSFIRNKLLNSMNQKQIINIKNENPMNIISDENNEPAYQQVNTLRNVKSGKNINILKNIERNQKLNFPKSEINTEMLKNENENEKLNNKKKYRNHRYSAQINKKQFERNNSNNFYKSKKQASTTSINNKKIKINMLKMRLLVNLYQMIITIKKLAIILQ